MKPRNNTLTVYNNTSLTLAEIAALPVLGRLKLLWRKRNVVICAHPTDPSRCISDGTTFGLDGPGFPMRVICDELLKDFPDLNPEVVIIQE